MITSQASHPRSTTLPSAFGKMRSNSFSSSTLTVGEIMEGYTHRESQMARAGEHLHGQFPSSRGSILPMPLTAKRVFNLLLPHKCNKYRRPRAYHPSHRFRYRELTA